MAQGAGGASGQLGAQGSNSQSLSYTCIKVCRECVSKGAADRGGTLLRVDHRGQRPNPGLGLACLHCSYSSIVSSIALCGLGSCRRMGVAWWWVQGCERRALGRCRPGKQVWGAIFVKWRRKRGGMERGWGAAFGAAFPCPNSSTVHT